MPATLLPAGGHHLYFPLKIAAFGRHTGDRAEFPETGKSDLRGTIGSANVPPCILAWRLLLFSGALEMRWRV